MSSYVEFTVHTGSKNMARKEQLLTTLHNIFSRGMGWNVCVICCSVVGWFCLAYKAIRVAVMHANYDGQAETMSLLLKQHCHESSNIIPCLVALYDGSQKCLQRNSSMINMDFSWSCGWQWWFRTRSGYIKEPACCEAALVAVSLVCDSYCLWNGSRLSTPISLCTLLV